MEHNKIIIHETATPEEKEAFFSAHPPKLCKYRDWSNDCHKKILTKNEMYFSSPGRFNDPYDCGLPFKQHPENIDPVIIKQVVEASAPGMFPHISHDKKLLEEKCAQQVILIQQNPESWFETNWRCRPEDLHKTFGVLSLTPHPDNYLMWSHYSSSHTGFCVEFDTRKLVESVAGHYQEVNYAESIPFFSIKDIMDDELITKLLYTKAKIWGYEDEYRISRINKPDTPIKFDPAALTAVYFGCKTSYEDIAAIIKITTPLYPNAEFRKFELDKHSFKLTPGDISLM